MIYLWAFIIACCAIMIVTLFVVDRVESPVSKVAVSITCVFSMLGAVIGILATMIVQANAEDRGAWFKSLKQPDTGISCCDISDCKRTDASWRAGIWHATAGDGTEVEIPPAKIVDIESIDGEAYVCLSPFKTVYCFIKPNPGY